MIILLTFFSAIAFSLDQKQVAVGGNDNLVTIWDVKDWGRPTLVHKLAHRAAIKAMEYCPWAPYLLATGAGSQDRALRFDKFITIIIIIFS